MRSRRGLIAALLALTAALAIVAAAFASPNKATAPTAQAVKCGTTHTIPFLTPVTGPAASLGGQQQDWARFYVATYNKSHKTKIKLVLEDTMLGAPNGTAEALKAVQAVASNPNVLAIVGPIGSNEIVATTKSLMDAGLGF